MDIYDEWHKKSKELWSKTARRVDDDYARLLEVARAAEALWVAPWHDEGYSATADKFAEALAAVEDLL